MAVTLKSFDLRQPDGELADSLFPNGDLDELLAAWLAQAIAKVEANTTIATANHNLAAAAWVYYRAYGYVGQRFASAPVRVSASLDGTVAKEMAEDQRSFWTALIAEKLAEYESYETEGDSKTAVVPAFFGRVRASTTTNALVY